MSSPRGHGWFWSAGKDYIQNNKHSALDAFISDRNLTFAATFTSQTLEQVSDELTTSVLPIFRNRFRLDDRLLELQQITRQLTRDEIKNAVLFLRARILLDVAETKSWTAKFSGERISGLADRRAALNVYYTMLPQDEQKHWLYDLNSEEQVTKQPIGPWGSLYDMISWINLGRLFWVWTLGFLVSSATIWRPNSSAAAVLSTAAPYQGHLSYLVYPIRGLFKGLEYFSLAWGDNLIGAQVGWLERLAYYLDEARASVVNDIVVWGPGNIVTCGQLHIVNDMTGGILTFAMLGIDLAMALDELRDARASYLQQITELNAVTDPRTKLELLKYAEIKWNKAIRDAVWAVFCASLLVVALLICCVALCYVGLPVATLLALNLACSAICFATGFLRETGNCRNSVQYETEMKNIDGTSADNIKKHELNITKKIMLTKSNIAVLVSLSVAALLILSLAAWPAWLAIVAVICIAVVLYGIQQVYLHYNKPQVADVSSDVPLSNDSSEEYSPLLGAQNGTP